MNKKHAVRDNMDALHGTRTDRPSSLEEDGCFPERLEIALKGRSSRSFAREAGVSESVFRKYLSGQSEPTRPALIAMAQEAGVRVGWLAIGEEPMMAAEAASLSTSQSARLRLDTLAQAIGLVQGLLSGRGTLSASDYGEAVAGFYEVLSTKPDALAGTVVELSEFVARRANRGNTHAGPGSTG